MMNRMGLKIGDLFLMVLIFFGAVLLFFLPFFQNSGAEAEIVIVETGETQMISLSKDGQYQVTSRGIELTVSVADGKAFVSHADCRDGICRNTPPVSRPGQSIICAPAGVMIRVLGEEAVVDGVSG